MICSGLLGQLAVCLCAVDNLATSEDEFAGILEEAFCSAPHFSSMQFNNDMAGVMMDARLRSVSPQMAHAIQEMIDQLPPSEFQSFGGSAAHAAPAAAAAIAPSPADVPAVEPAVEPAVPPEPQPQQPQPQPQQPQPQPQPQQPQPQPQPQSAADKARLSQQPERAEEKVPEQKQPAASHRPGAASEGGDEEMEQHGGAADNRNNNEARPPFTVLVRGAADGQSRSQLVPQETLDAIIADPQCLELPKPSDILETHQQWRTLVRRHVKLMEYVTAKYWDRLQAAGLAPATSASALAQFAARPVEEPQRSRSKKAAAAAAASTATALPLVPPTSVVVPQQEFASQSLAQAKHAPQPKPATSSSSAASAASTPAKPRKGKKRSVDDEEASLPPLVDPDALESLGESEPSGKSSSRKKKQTHVSPEQHCRLQPLLLQTDQAKTSSTIESGREQKCSDARLLSNKRGSQIWSKISWRRRRSWTLVTSTRRWIRPRLTKVSRTTTMPSSLIPPMHHPHQLQLQPLRPHQPLEWTWSRSI